MNSYFGHAPRVVLAAAAVLVCPAPASAQRLNLPCGVTARTPPIVVVTHGAAAGTSARRQPLTRHLTSEQKTAIVGAAFPAGLPAAARGTPTVDPTGLSTQVVLGPKLMYDSERGKPDSCSSAQTTDRP